MPGWNWPGGLRPHAASEAGAKEFLLRCHQAGERMAVLTSCMPPLCQAALERHGLLPLLERVITTKELGLEKARL